jgi:hypothetical protein
LRRTSTSIRRQCRIEGPLLDSWGVYHAIVDPRDGALDAAANHLVDGPNVRRSTDGGKTWKRSGKLGLPEDSGLGSDSLFGHPS